MKKLIATAILTITAAHTHADVIEEFNLLEDKGITVEKEVATVDTVIGASAGTGLMAGIASWALPTAIAHSSGGAIIYSGAGYVAGTMGVAAGTVAALPFIAAGAAAVGTGAVVYKYYGDEIDALYDETMGYINDEEQ